MSILAHDEAPMTLAEACETVFRGAMTVATLRAEAARGRLAIFRIGRRLYTTHASVREMIELCRVEPKVRGSISIKREATLSSETVRRSCALAALDQTLSALKGSSPNTFPASTSRRRAQHQ